jgi:putative transcriptional regulator
MTTTHVDDRLFELALGTLGDTERGEAEAHLADCARCAGELAGVRETLGALPLALEPALPPPALRVRLLAEVTGPSRFAAFIDRVAEMLDVAAERARAMLADLVDATRWQPGFSPGMELVHVHGGPRVAHAITGFVRMAPGTRFPLHKHVGAERVIVLQGAFRDSDGSVYRAGDETSMGPGSEHEFEAIGDVDLVYLAVVLDGLQVGDEVLTPDDPRA